MRLYTPGHGIITDTLIMHGLVRIISANNIIDGTVIREGIRYVIDINAEKISAKVDFLDTLLRETKLYTQNEKVRSAYKYLSKIDASNINIDYYKKWISHLSEGIEKLDINEFLSFDHRDKLKERRVKSKKLKALPLPLSFIYGEYFQDSYKVEKKPYSVCLNCYVLSTLGLIFGTSIIFNINKDKKTVNLITIGPSDKMKIVDVLVIQRLLEKKPLFFKNDLPILASLLYILSLGETLYALDENIEAIVWRLTKSGNSQRASFPITINIKDLLDKISTIKYHFPEFPRFIDECLINDEDCIVALNDLAFYLIYGGDSYGVLRKISRIVIKSQGKCNYNVAKLSKALERM